jgi:hypothetical protein
LNPLCVLGIQLNVSDPTRQTALLTSMLYDFVKAVRMEAARRMNEIAANIDIGGRKKWIS